MTRNAKPLPSQDHLSKSVVIFGQQSIALSLLESALHKAGCECNTYHLLPDLLERPNLECCVVIIDFMDMQSSCFLQTLDVLEGVEKKPKVVITNVLEQENSSSLMGWSVVKGIFHQDESPYVMLKGICAVLSGETWFPRSLLEEFLEKHRNGFAHSKNVSEISLKEFSQCADALTPRESEILILLSTGSSNNDIAEKLCLSPHTIKTHLYNIYRKIDVDNRLQAVNWAKVHLV